MADSTDIREWARLHGKDVGDRGRIPADVRAAYEAEQGGEFDGFVPVPELGETPPFTPGNGQTPTTGAAPGGSSTPPLPGPSTGETTPGPTPRRRWYQSKPRTDEPKSRTKTGRASAERAGSWAWKFAGYALRAASPATGYVMEIQAPVAGMAIDQLIAGTIVDKIIQPLLRTAEGGEEAWGLIGPPAIVFALDHDPAWAPFLMPLLEDAMTGWLALAGPLMAKARRREEKALAALKEMGDGEGAPQSVRDLIEEIPFRWAAEGWVPPGTVVQEEPVAAA